MDNSRRIIAVSILLAGITAAIIWHEQLSVDVLIARVGQLGWMAPLVFIACYGLSSVFVIPGLLFTLSGGVLFGPLYGTFYSLIGATLGATLAFLTSRYLAHDWVKQRTGKRLHQLVAGVEQEGWRFVAFTRLVPIFPFNILNYALGLTKIRLSHYVITSFVFMLPSAAAYTYLGYAGREVAEGGDDVIRTILLAIALIATLAFASRVWMRMRRDRINAP